jgi:hypothetical protein
MKIHYPAGRPPAGTDVLWRCEAKRYSYAIDADGDEYGVTDPRLEMWWHRVTKRTAKGAWTCSRFVLLTAHKRWARSTEQEALESFQARKKKQIKILTAQLRRAEAELALLDDDRADGEFAA